MAVGELPRELEDRARALHREAFVYDASFSTGGFFRDEEGEIRAIVEGGLNGVSGTVAEFTHNFVRAVDSIWQHRKVIERHPQVVQVCTTVADLERCKREGKIGFVIHFQDSKPIADSLDYLRTFHELGLRGLQLTYNVRNWVGTGCCERHDPGLSSFGLEVVEECNRLGIFIDLSHCGHTTAREAIERSRHPVAFTHVGAYALCPAYGRNKPDDLLKALAEKGGVVGITLFPPFVKKNPTTHEVLPSSVEDVLDHVDYVARLVGVDHVGIGTDMSTYHARTRELPPGSSIRSYRTQRPDVFGTGRTDRFDPFPAGLDSHAKLPNLTRGLVRRGYGDEEVKKILGGNWLRLLRQVWGR